MSIKTISCFVLGCAVGVGATLLFPVKKAIEKHTPSKKEICHKLKKIGIPLGSVPIYRDGYALCYDGRTKNPVWVYEHLNQNNLQLGTHNALFKFNEDPLIPEKLRTKLEDYRDPRFERGHLCPPADQRLNNETMAETFFLSNVSPQVRELKQGFWKHLEREVRSWAQEYTALDVFTGPLYLPKRESNGKAHISYEVIGPHSVAVPTHFFKVIQAEDRLGHKTIKAFVIPNQKISEKRSLDDFTVSLEELEQLSGLLFFN